MGEAGRLSEQSLLMLSGKRSMRNGPRGHQRSFPSGLVRDQARRLVMLRLLRGRKRAVKKHQQKRNMMKKKKSKQRSQKLLISQKLCFFESLLKTHMNSAQH